MTPIHQNGTQCSEETCGLMIGTEQSDLVKFRVGDDADLCTSSSIVKSLAERRNRGTLL